MCMFSVEWRMQLSTEIGCYSTKFSAYVFLQCDFVEDEVYSSHLGKYGAIAEGVAQCSQPRPYLWVCTSVEVREL